MKLSLLNYDLPPSQIANSPVTPRDHSKLLVLNRKTRSISHKRFYDIFDLLGPGDVLVFNDTKVFPGRLFGKKSTGGKVEVLFLKNTLKNVWEILGKGIPPVGGIITFPNFYAKVVSKTENTALVDLSIDRSQLLSVLEKSGQTPLPPYIHSTINEKTVRDRYQTVYAKNQGSAAAPTAGFHFTAELMEKLTDKGVQMEYVTLHVGAGTFLPVKEENIEKHKMHSEWVNLSHETAKRLNQAKSQGQRIIAVGTTATRVLECCAVNNKLTPTTGETDIFIYPPYKFQFVDALITNFHLPHSTLLALVSAFVSKPNTAHEFRDFGSSSVGNAYKEAIENDYRFYSFGDAMIIL